MQQLRKFTDAKDEAQREQAQHAARPVLTKAEQATCIYHAMCAAVATGDRAKARELAAKLQPLVAYLPEGR